MLYKVWRKNPYFPMGTIYRKFDDGVEKCVMREKNGRQEIVGYVGMVIPFDEIEPFVIRIQKTGIDRRALLSRQANAF